MSLLQMQGGSVTEQMHIDERFVAGSKLEHNVSTQSSEFVRYAPIGGIAGNQIEFQVDPSVGYIDLKNSYILSQVRIRKDGGQPLSSDIITLKAYTSLLQWSDIRTYVNDVELSDENSGLYPFSAFSKVALGESNVKQSTLTIIPGNENSLGVITSSDPRLVEGVVAPDAFPLCGGLNSMTSQFQRIRFGTLSTANGWVDVVSKPKDGIWTQKEYLQPNLRMRIVLTKNTDSAIIEDNNATLSTDTLEYNNCYLYLKRVYPSESMGALSKQVQMDQGLLYTLLRARTAQVQYNNNQTSLSATGLLAGMNPSTVIVGFYSVTDPTTSAYRSHPFNSGLRISSLYIRVGGMRIPENYDYERPDTTQLNSWVDYNEYVLACKASSYNTTTSDNETPVLSYEAYKNFSFFVFNCKANKETMWGRDDSSNAKGAVDVYARFNSGGSSAQNQMIVIGLGHDKVHIDKDGKVNRLGW